MESNVVLAELCRLVGLLTPLFGNLGTLV